MNTAIYRWLVGVAGLTLLTSCAHLPRTQRDSPVVIPESYSFATGGKNYPDRWWTVFQDEQLNKIVVEAVGNNLGLQQVQHRLEQAQAVARKTGAEQMPQLSLNGSAGSSHSVQMDPSGAKQLQTVDQFGLNLAASYELDLWGRVGATRRAAVLDAETVRDNLETAVMTLVAQITEIWYQLAALQERLTLLRGQIKSGEDQLHLIKLRFNTGQAIALDVWQQRDQLAALRTLLPRLEALRVTTSHQLAVLLGRSPKKIEDLVPSRLPVFPSLPGTGIPADLLQKRPDVRSAFNALRAADESVAVAVADRLPALRLTATGGYSAAEAGDLFDDWIWNIAGNILAPLLDGSRRRAEVKRANAVADERLARCGEVLLNAMREVEDALVRESKQAEMLKHQTEQLKITRQALKQVRARYRRGLNDYQSVLAALAREQAVARVLVEVRRELLSYRIQLYRSLGGNWMGSATLSGGEVKDE